MKKIVRLAGLTVMALSLTTGVAMASSGSIGTTGPDSYNKVEFEHRNRTRVRNDNNVGVGNVNLQLAKSGDARVRHNTTGGSARSGDATNDSLTRTSVSIDNGNSALGSGSAGNHSGSIHNTGPDSYNKVSFKSSNNVRVRNNNHVGVVNMNVQAAASGDASVKDNTTGGNATSGDATNVNTTETSIDISN